MKKRVEVYDIIRVALIILVVIGHSGYRTINFGSGGINYFWPPDVNPIQNSFIFRHLRDGGAYLYLFHMPLFFVLSGAVSYLQKENYLSFTGLVKKKARRLLVPYYACGLLFMLPVKWLTGGYAAGSIWQAVYNFVLGIADTGHLWFLFALFWCFLIFYVFYHLIYRTTGKMILAVVAAGITQTVFMYVPFNPFESGRALTNILWFALGVYFEYHRPKLEILLKRVLPLVAVVTAAGLVMVVQDYRHSFLPINARIIVFWFLLYFLGLLITEKTKLTANRAYRFFLRNCMSVYLYHDPLEYVVLYFAFGYGWLASLGGSVLYLFLRTVGVVLVSLLIAVAIGALKAWLSGRKPFRRLKEKA